MKSAPIVSVIIPMYNAADRIDKCINSILESTYKNLQIIIVDDGSTDDSYEKCQMMKKKDPRIELYRKKNGGVSSARNYAITLIKGEYFHFVDSDDEISTVLYERCISELVKENADWISFNHTSNVSYLELNKFSGNTEIINGDILKHFLERHGSAFWSKIFSKKMLKYLHYPEGVHNGEDIVAMVGIMKYATKGIVLHKTLYYWHVSKNSLSRKKVVSLYNPNEQIYQNLKRENYPIDVLKTAKMRSMSFSLTTINKVLQYGLESEELEEEFICMVKELQELIRKRYLLIVKSKYFSKVVKTELIILSISYKIYVMFYKMLKRL